MATPDVPNRPMVIIPLGATEQHGPHLPLDTDTVIASAWAESVADLLKDDGMPVVVAPALAYGSSGEHDGFSGTLSLGADALILALVELGRSARDWAGPLVLLSGHAGNYEALDRAADTLRAEGDSVTTLVPILAGADAHAGRTETSLMLHLDPSRVQLDVAEAGRTEPIGELIDSLREHGVRSVSPNGVLGDPMGANADEGQAILAALAADAVERIRAADLNLDPDR